ncbi:MAG: GntR family transcriptional regulator [Clostridia bacterium]|nr:GntR family transcriptional regulator [Clostridia bacterium]
MPKRSVNLSEPAYNHLLNLIMTKQLMPGDRIPETRIAKEFNISRTPVRDAMRQLCNDGLIEIFPNRFAQVRVFSPEDIREIGTVRVALDTLSIKLANLYGSHADFLRLQALATQCSEAFTEGHDRVRLSSDSEFHLELSRIAGNELLFKFQKELQLRIQFIQLHHPTVLENELLHIQQHHEIVKALMDHDEKLAETLICNHLKSFYNLENDYPENFFPITL